MWPHFVLYLMCFAISQTKGVEFSLDLESNTMSGGQTTCGVLRCAEETTRPASVIDIMSMTLFKRVSGPGDRHRVTVVDLSRQQPNVSRFWNGIKVDGTWTPGKAEVTLHLVETDDCRLAEFSCQVTFQDGLGQERRSLSVVGRAGGEPALSTGLIDNTPDTPGKVPATNVVLSGRDGTSMAAALQLSAIIQQAQTSLADKVQHAQDRLEDKMADLDESLSDLERRVGSRFRLDERRGDRNNLVKWSKNNTSEILTALKENMESLERNVSSTAQDSVTEINTLSSSVAKLEHSLVALLKKSTNSSNHLLQTLLEAVTKSETSVKAESETTDTPQQVSSCTRDNDGPSVAAYHVVYPSGDTPPYLCDADGGWTVIQRRSSGDVDFYRDWASYKKGFGSFDGDFWLGNDMIHNLTSSAPHELMVKLKYGGKMTYAHYDAIFIAGEDNNYRLTLGEYTGTAGDSLEPHNNHDFSTFDRDNDVHGTLNCAKHYRGAWWYEGCHNSNLNGEWGSLAGVGPRWSSVSGSNPVTYSEMIIRLKVM